MSSNEPPRVDYPVTRVVQDRFEECIYRPGQVARCPARVPLQRLSPEQLDMLLDEGDQRVGGTVFRPECPFCTACEPVRVDIRAFAPSRSQRRVQKRNEDIRVEIANPQLSRRRVAMWNRHRAARGLMTESSRRDPIGYQEWLVDSCAVTREVRYWLDDRMVAVSVLDFGRESANSAYCYYDPRYADRSLGVYSVLWEMEHCRSLGMRWYYLGLWVADCSALRYKTNYLPHERLVRGRWVRFEQKVEPTPHPDANPVPDDDDCEGPG